MARDRIPLLAAFTRSEHVANGGYMKSESKQADDRRCYEPPRLATISLRPEEAVLGHCKTPTGGTMGSVCSNFFAPCTQSFGS
jgi:hypothetical protein